MNILLQTAKQLSALAEQQPAVLVSFSGGKDSRVVLDMARRTFKKVVGLFYYFVPGLRYDAENLQIAQDWGIDVLQYPDPAFIESLRSGVFCFQTDAHYRLPKWEQPDVYAAARNDTGIQTILTGMKKADSMVRRRMLKTYTAKNVVHPLLNWKTFDVLAYCKIHNIPLPKVDPKRNSNGVGLALAGLTFLYENFYDDYEKVCEWFPFSRAVIKREQWYWGYTGSQVVPVREVHPGTNSSA